jgi:hypothetical protein
MDVGGVVLDFFKLEAHCLYQFVGVLRKSVLRTDKDEKE